MDALDADTGAVQRLIMSDKAQPHLSRYVNKQNHWNWSDKQVFGKYPVCKSWFGVQCQLMKLLDSYSVMKATVH
jgi:hypothetical protein